MNQLAPLIEAFGWTLLHFVWQGAGIAALLWVVLRVTMRRAAPEARHGAAGAALVLMLGVASATLWRQGVPVLAATTWSSPPRASAAFPPGHLSAEANPARPFTAVPASQPAPLDPTARPVGASWLRTGDFIAVLPRMFPWLVSLWAAGSGLLSLRALNSWRLVRRLRVAAQAQEAGAWTTRFDRIRERLRVSRSVRLLSSASAAVPMVIGWIKPAVLVPTALFAGLPAAHLEAILAHELAHVRRHDYLINLLQTAVETLLFYHPAVWWVSAQLRIEREHCCDDIASSVCGSRLDYACALASLEEVRGSAQVFGIAATGGSLLRRVRRLLGVADEHVRGAAWPVGFLALVVLVAAVALTLLTVAGEPPASTPQARAAGGDGVPPEKLQPSTQYESESARLRSAKVQPFAFTRAKLKDVLGFLAEKAGIKYRALAGSASDTDAMITFKIVASPFVALESVSQACGVALTLDQDVWHMRLMDDRPSRDQEVVQSSPEYESVSARLRSAKAYPFAFTRARFKDVLRFLAEEAGINFMGLPESEHDKDRQITFSIMASPFVALETVSQAYGVALILDHDVWHMRRLEDSQRLEGNDTPLANSIRPLPVIEFRFVADAAGPDTETLPVPKHWNDTQKSLEVRKSAILGARDVVSATPEQDATTGLWDIDLRLTDKGARKLSKSSKENIGKQLAIVMNGRVISAPVVRGEIGSQVMVSGHFSQVEANEFAGAIRKAAATADPAVESTLRVIVLGDEIRLDGSPVALDDLEQRLRKDLSSNPGTVVTLRSEAGVQYQRVKDVIEVVTKLGIPQVGLATKPAGQEPPVKTPAQSDQPTAKASSPAAILQFRLVADTAGPDTEKLPVPKPGKDQPAVLDLEKAVVVRAADVASATAKHNAKTGFWDIDLLLTDQGGENLAKASEANVGRQLAIVVNHEVISAPTITSEIGSEVMISGRLSEAEANQLVGTIQAAVKSKSRAILLNGDGGILLDNSPVTLKELEQRLRRDFTSNPEMAVIVQGDTRTQYQRVMHVLDVVGKVGITQVGLATMPDNPQPAVEKKGIRISVLDAAGQKPLREFRVVAGVKSQVSVGQEVVNWQPHTVRVGKDGELTWPLDMAYDEMALRVEADGYAPQVSKWMLKSQGAMALSIDLIEDNGIAGRVFTPSGRPAAGATVALAMVQRAAVIEGGKLRDLGKTLPDRLPGDGWRWRWRWPIFVQADDDGRFQLPAESDPTGAVLLVHDEGVLEMALADFMKSPEVRLQSWGRLEGRVLWGDKPGADQPVSVTIHRDAYGYPGVIAQSETTRSAADGSFVVERVLPGLAQVSCPILANPNKSGITEINFPGRTTHVTVQPGPTPVLIGGQGRSVKGRLTGRDSWEGVTFHFHPTAPHIGLPGDEEMWKAWGEFQKGALGPVFFRNGLKEAADGTFEITGVLPGDYQIFFSREGESGQVASGKFSVDAETPGKKPDAQDLGEFRAGLGGK